MKRKIEAIILSFLMAVSLGGCGFEDTISDVLLSRTVWVDSDLDDAVSADKEIRLQDDFAAAVNREWKLQQKESSDLFEDLTDTVMENKKKIVTDETIEGYEAKLLRNYYSLATDWDARNEDGTKPLNKYIDKIMSAGSMEELSEWMCDPDTNPLAIAPLYIEEGYVTGSGVYKDKYIVYLMAPQLTLDPQNGAGHGSYFSIDSDVLERIEQLTDVTDYFLEKAGYTKKEAKAILEDCFSFEKRIAAADNPDPSADEEDMTFNREEIMEFAGDYPLEKYLNSIGFTENDLFGADKGYVKKLEGIWKDSNLREAKGFFAVRYIIESVPYLDRETIDAVKKFYESRSEEKENEYTEEEQEDSLVFDKYIGGTSMAGAMNKLYVERFFDESTVGELNEITHDLIDVFREIFKSEEWLSEEGKKACIEKLDAISVHIAYQDFDAVDYNDMKLITRGDGGNFLEAYYETCRFMLKHYSKLSMKKYDRDFWDPTSTMLSTTITNAMYSPNTNGIYIFAGICEAPAYSPELSYEEKLAGLFMIVGHEITHGFDNGGAQYNKIGEKENWLPLDDQTAFNDLCDGVGNYYTLMSPYPSSGFYKGQDVTAEATADMGGLKATLALAKKHDGFDYDKYFKAFAGMWRVHIPLEKEKMYFSSDSHPLAFYRVNVGVQQFDEFYKTYDVKETDGMYLAPESRISVW